MSRILGDNNEKNIENDSAIGMVNFDLGLKNGSFHKVEEAQFID